MPVISLKTFLKDFDFSSPNWENLPRDFPKVDFDGLNSEEVSKLNSVLTLWELHRGELCESKSTSRNLPFRISVIEKTTRQAQSLQGYKASAAWQTSSLLRDLVQLLLTHITEKQFRRKTQLEDASRSMVSTFEEGWGRPSTREFLDYIGFSQASLNEIRGDIERLHTDGYLKSEKEVSKYSVPTPSRNFPYPPVNSRRNPADYGKLSDRLREYTGKEVKAKELTFELFVEFVNKVDYLLKRTVEGLQQKVIREEKQKLRDKINSSWNNNY